MSNHSPITGMSPLTSGQPIGVDWWMCRFPVTLPTTMGERSTVCADASAGVTALSPPIRRSVHLVFIGSSPYLMRTMRTSVSVPPCWLNDASTRNG